MNKPYSVHLCGSQGQECADVLIDAPTADDALDLALANYPEYGAVRLNEEEKTNE